MNRDKQEYLNESSDLLFHLLVLNEQMGLGIEQILERLESTATNRSFQPNMCIEK